MATNLPKPADFSENMHGDTAFTRYLKRPVKLISATSDFSWFRVDDNGLIGILPSRKLWVL